MSATEDRARKRKAGPGRPEDPIDENLPKHRRDFAQGLRDLRNDCGTPAYSVLGDLAHRSASRLSDAANGRQLPTWDITRAYVEACLRYAQREQEIRRVSLEWETIWRTTENQDKALVSGSSPSAHTVTDFDKATDGSSPGGLTTGAGENPYAVDDAVVQPTEQPDDVLWSVSADAHVDLTGKSGTRVTPDESLPSNDDQDAHDDPRVQALGTAKPYSLLTRRTALIGLVTTAVGMGAGAIVVRTVWPHEHTDAAPEQPIRVTSSYLWHPEDDYLYAVPGPLSPDQGKRVMQASHPDEWAWLVQEADAVRFGDTPTPDGPQFSRLDLSLQSVWSEPVLLTKIHASVRRRSAPLGGALVVAGAQGETDVVKIGFDLDNTADTAARVLDERFELGERYTDVKKISLAPKEFLPLQVMAQTQKYYCEWTLEFGVEVGGKLVNVVIYQGDGKPFRSTAFTNQYATVYEYDLNLQRVLRIPGVEWQWGR